MVRVGEVPVAVEAGTVIDDLTSLSGCWASVTAEETKPIRLYAVFQFDSGSRRYRSWSMQRDVFGLHTVAFGESGRFEVLDGGQLALWYEQIFYVDLRTGELVAEDLPPASQPTIEQLAMLTGEWLILGGGDPPCCFYRRMGCPQ